MVGLVTAVVAALFVLAAGFIVRQWPTMDTDRRVGNVLLLVGFATNTLLDDLSAAAGVDVPAVGTLELVGLAVGIVGVGVIVVRPFTPSRE